MPDDDPVLCTIDPRGVATLTLNRPAVGNAYNDGMISKGMAPGKNSAVSRE